MKSYNNKRENTRDNNSRDNNRDSRDNSRGREPYNKSPRNNNRFKGDYKSEFRNQNNTESGPPREKRKTGDSVFTKNPSGFLVVSIFVPKNSSSESACSTIQSLLVSEHKKKIVICIEDNKDLLHSIKKRFENTFGVFFFTPKAKMGSNSIVNSSVVHNEVLNSFKSHFFLTLTAGITLREFSLEKMISFLSKQGDTIAISPKLYTTEGEIIKNCKRFFTFADFFTKSEEEKKKKNLEHLMMERGEIGYYSIHRIDYGTLDCMLFLSDALIKAGSICAKSVNKDLRDAKVCKRLAKKGPGKIIFYPHARAISTITEEEKNFSLMEKLRYVLV